MDKRKISRIKIYLQVCSLIDKKENFILFYEKRKIEYLFKYNTEEQKWEIHVFDYTRSSYYSPDRKIVDSEIKNICYETIRDLKIKLVSPYELIPINFFEAINIIRSIKL